MVHTVPHDVDPALLRRAVAAAFAAYEARFARYQPTLRWEGDDRARFGFRVRGRALGGVLQLYPDFLELHMDVPLLLRVFEGRARRAVDEEVQRWLDRARGGEL